MCGKLEGKQRQGAAGRCKNETDKQGIIETCFPWDELGAFFVARLVGVYITHNEDKTVRQSKQVCEQTKTKRRVKGALRCLVNVE